MRRFLLVFALGLMACSGTTAGSSTSGSSGSHGNSTGTSGSTTSSGSGGSTSASASTGSSGSSSGGSSCSTGSSGASTTGASSGSRTSSSGAGSSTGSTSGGNAETCESAAILTEAATVTGDTSSAVDDYHFASGSASCTGARNTGKDLVFAFTPSTTGTYTFHVGFLGFDAALYLLDACPPTLDGSGNVASCPAGVDAHGSTTAEDLVVGLTAGTTYYLVVDSFSSGAGGTFELSVIAGP